MGQCISRKRQRVLAVCVHPGNLFWRRILDGILTACLDRGWLPIAIPDTSYGLALLKHQRIDAAIVNLRNRPMTLAVAGLGMPLVNLGHADGGQPRVRLDDPTIGCSGAQALLAAGCRHLAFAGEHLGAWAAERRLGAQAADHRCWLGSAPETADGYREWIRGLPHDAGVLAANDEIAAQVAQAAANCDRPVPRSLRILGVDDDDLQCRFARTQLSSLRLDLERLGSTAVATCDDLLAGRRVPHDLRLAQVSVVERSSTSGACLGGMREILLRLRSGPLDGIAVGRVAAAAGMSRRTLGRRMRRELGLTPRAALLEQRIAQAEARLRSTTEPLSVIARDSGFCSASHLCQAFRRARGATPGSWRKGR